MTDTVVSRREVLHLISGSAAGLAAAAVMADSLQGQETADGAIDAHSHIWTREIKNFPLAAGKTIDDLSPASFTAEELLQVARADNVERVVLISHHPYYGFDNRYLLDAAARYPDLFRVVAALDESQPHVDRRMRDLLAQRVTGFRITPLVSGAKWLESAGMNAMWQTAAETRQAMCCLINPEHLPQLATMCMKHRETPVVIDHFARIGMSGNVPTAELDQLCDLARFEGVTVKISAYYALGKKQPPYHDLVPMIKRLYDCFGPQRLMWASDSPYQLQGNHSYRASISLVREHLNFVSDSDRNWMLRGTANRVYFFA